MYLLCTENTGTPTYRRRRAQNMYGFGGMITKASGPFFSETGKGYTPAARRKLDEILEYEKIRNVFQPIVSLEDGSIPGYEALSRGPEGLESPDALFSISRDFGKLRELWTFYVAIL